MYPWHNCTPSISDLWNCLKPYKKPFPIKCINSGLLHNWYYFCYNFIIAIINVIFPIIICYYYLLCHIYRYLLPYNLFCPTQIKNENQKQQQLVPIYSYQLNLISKHLLCFHVIPENIIQRYFVKKVFLKFRIIQRKNICNGVFFW